ncbi:MAG TPA: DUF5004 domain-containing protein [Cyclobacteriaceae bacterium]
MKRTYSTILVILIHLVSFGQQKKQDKSEAVTKQLIGSWKLDYALYRSEIMGVVSKEKSKIFHTDTIHFFSDKTFKFKSHDTENVDIRIHTGTWEITDKGKTLVQKNRQAVPGFDGPLPDLFFPIKIINSDRIRIDYTVYLNDDNSNSKAANTPVFFERIK